MAVKRDGEQYLGTELRAPLSEDGQVAVYVWPIRIVVIQGVACGGPTIGVDVGNEEIIRFDCHDVRGHWHSGGYDSNQPGNSQNTMPDGVVAAADQVEWSIKTIRDDVRYLLMEANHDEAAKKIDSKLVESALASINAHLAQAGDMRTKLIANKLIAA